MTTLTVELGERSYPIYIGDSLLGQAELLKKHIPGNSALIVTNETVAPLYLEKTQSMLSGLKNEAVILPDGEKYKNLEVLNQIYDGLLRNRFDRNTTVIALGGGVVGDMAGFAAASYQRGVHLIQIPTTLLSQVDSSVGGKTGFNHPSGKNLIGAFHQPTAVLVDIETLETLAAREFSAGLAEVVKIAAIRDAEFLDWLENNSAAIMAREPGAITGMIKRSIANKADVVAEDERESGVRALLNFGHSFAHALETLTNYTLYLHGEAVSIGMMVAGRLSEIRGLCASGFSDRLGKLLQSFDLPLDLPAKLDPADILETMKLDKKVIAGSARLILVESAGQGFIDSNSERAQIVAAIKTSQTTS